MIFMHLQGEAKARSGNAANKDRKNLIAAWGYGAKYVDQFPPGNPCFVDRFSKVRQRRYVTPERDFLKVLEQAESHCIQEQQSTSLITQ